jgi:plasmid stabilization system protein ParE
MRTHIRPQFYTDVADEIEWLARQATAEIAERWAAAVWRTIKELEQHPHLGRERPDLPFPGVRSWRVRDFHRWLIFYGRRDDTLILYRVRHGALNLLALDYD